MLSWASSQFEKLSVAVAPPPTDANGRFVYCVQRGDEDGALQCLHEIDAARAVLNPAKGIYAIHMACEQSMDRLIRSLLQVPGVDLTFIDSQGNTPLHYACMSTDKSRALSTIKMLVTEFKASVVAKNSVRQTPYDLASLDTVRQFLLPLQLQEETRQCIDNGGIGLPPGIDMGGLRIANPAQPPPPIMSIHPAPAPMSSPVQHVYQTPQHDVPKPPVSGQREYARTGSSSAAIYKPADRRYVKADGFHSSSSDVNLQRKYGHVSVPTAGAVPPPPSSGNAVGSAFPPVAPSGPNPFAGGANPYASGRANQRYVAYDPITGKAIPMANRPPPPSQGYGQPYGAAPVPNVAVFSPSGAPAASNVYNPALSAPAASAPTPAQNPPVNQFYAAPQAVPGGYHKTGQQFPEQQQPPASPYAPSGAAPPQAAPGGYQSGQQYQQQQPASPYVPPGVAPYGQQQQQQSLEPLQASAPFAGPGVAANSYGQQQPQEQLMQQQQQQQQPYDSAYPGGYPGTQPYSQEQTQPNSYQVSQQQVTEQASWQQQQQFSAMAHNPPPTSGGVPQFSDPKAASALFASPPSAGAPPFNDAAPNVFASPALNQQTTSSSSTANATFPAAPVSGGFLTAPQATSMASASDLFASPSPTKGEAPINSVAGSGINTGEAQNTGEAPPQAHSPAPGSAASATELFATATTPVATSTFPGVSSSPFPFSASANIEPPFDTQTNTASTATALFSTPSPAIPSNGNEFSTSTSNQVGQGAATMSPIGNSFPVSSSQQSATDMFSAPASVTDKTYAATAPGQVWNPTTPAARPVNSPDGREASTASSTAAELFASPGLSAASDHVATGEGKSPPKDGERTGSPSGSDELLDDVPLSPDKPPYPSMNVASALTAPLTNDGPPPAGGGGQPLSTMAADTAPPGAESLFAAIGMPPPPFSSSKR